MAETTAHDLFPAEHRALRELHVAARHLEGHWERLSERLDGGAATLLAEGAALARELAAETEARTAERDLHGVPGAQGLGAWLAYLRGAGDLLLERNQALRSAVLGLQHLVTLLGYLVALAEHRGDADLAGWERAWAERLEPYEARGRREVEALAADPDGAIAPADTGLLGRAGETINSAVGALGEYFDQSPLGRAARRRPE